MTDSESALRWLYGLAPRGMRQTLEPMREALARRGHPERGLRVVHVGGTNGKGSVAAMVALALARAGHRVGLYTSPHLHRFAERVRVNGRPVGARQLAGALVKLRRAAETPGFPELSFFETATLLAFELFREARVDLAVLEVGLGGRLDATNVFDRPEVAVITRIAMDHERWLGATIEEIAAEKAGIAKAGAPLVCSVRDGPARRVVLDRAREISAQALAIDRDFTVRPSPREGRARSLRMDFEGLGASFRSLALGLAGEHQHDNVACAVATCLALDRRGIAVPEAAVRHAVARVRWPARLEWLTGRPPVLLDAAHNPDGCSALRRYLDARPKARRALVFGASEDKDARAMLAALDSAFDARVFVRAPVQRAQDPAALARLAEGRIAADVRDALTIAREAAGDGGEIVVAGSIFVVAEARATILGLAADPLVAM